MNRRTHGLEPLSVPTLLGLQSDGRLDRLSVGVNRGGAGIRRTCGLLKRNGNRWRSTCVVDHRVVALGRAHQIARHGTLDGEWLSEPER